MTTAPSEPDLAAVKAKQQQTWASGDFSVVAARIVLVSEQLAESADLRAGSQVLDVACGNGNATLAAARSGAHAIGVDYVPALLEDGRARALAEGLDVEFRARRRRGAAGRDDSMDAVLSVFGTMFAPDHRGRPTRSSGSPGPAAPSGWRRGRRTASSAQMFRVDHLARARAGRCAVAAALGHRGAPDRALRRRRGGHPVAGAGLHVPVHVGRGVRDVLPPLVRPDAQGVRGARRGRAARAGRGPGRPGPAVRPARTAAASPSPSTYLESVLTLR